MKKLLLTALLICGCSFSSGNFPEQDPSSCEAACKNMGKLGCYPEDECLVDCKELEEDEAQAGKRTSHGCLEKAKNCEEAGRCD